MNVLSLVDNLFLPITLTTSFGVILLSTVQRYHYVVDHCRKLLKQTSEDLDPDFRKLVESNAMLMVRRSHILRNVIFFLVFGMFINSLIVLSTYFQVFLGQASENIIRWLLLTSISSIVISFALYSFDLAISLVVLDKEFTAHKNSYFKTQQKNMSLIELIKYIYKKPYK